MLVYVVESVDTDTFIADIIAKKKDSIIIHVGFEGRAGERAVARIAYAPPDMHLREPFANISISNRKLFYILYPILLIVSTLRMFCLFLFLGVKYRIHTVIPPGTYSCATLGILRSIGLFKNLIYVCGDWLPGYSSSKIWSYFGCNVVFPVADYLACRFSDITLNLTDRIAARRKALWGRTIPKREHTYTIHLRVKRTGPDHNPDASKILFLGDSRNDSCLDVVLKALQILKLPPSVGLKIVGNRNQIVEHVADAAGQLGMQDRVECTGFGDRSAFEHLFEDCFCGINLILGKSYTENTIPGKFFDYVQYLLPVLITRDAGEVARIVEVNELGLIVEPTEAGIATGIERLYRNRRQYLDNIKRFIVNSRSANVTEFIP